MKTLLEKLMRFSLSAALVILLYTVPLQVDAAVTYIGAGALGGATLTTDATAALPANTQVDDILIIHAWTRSTADTTVITGFTEFAQVDTGTGSHRWFWKRHTGTEGNATCDHNQSADNYCQMFAFRGVVRSGNPWNALGTPEADNSNTDPTTHTAITTGADDSMVVILMGYEDDDTTNAGSITGTDPASYTLVYTESTTGADATISMGYATRPTAGSTGTITYDYGGVSARSDDEGSVVFSLAPDPAPYYMGAGALGAAANTAADPVAALPTGTQADDLLIVYAWTRSTSDTTTIAGFTQFAQIDTGTGSHAWFWKRHSGSEGNATCDRTGTTGDSYCRMFAYRNVTTVGNPWNALGNPEADNGTTDPTSHTAITTGADNSLVVVFAGYEDDDASVGVMTGTDPANYAEVYAEATAGADGSITMGYAARDTAGSTGTISYDYGTIATRTDDEGSLVMSLAPAAPTFPSVTTGVAGNISPTAATLFGNIVNTGDSTITQHGFATSTDPTLSTGVATTTLGSGSSGEFSGNVVVTASDSVIYYRAYATNAIGTSFGTVRSFFTGNATPTRTMRLFQGYSVRFYNGGMVLYQQKQ